MPGHLVQQNPAGWALLCSIEAPKRSPRGGPIMRVQQRFLNKHLKSQRERERERESTTRRCAEGRYEGSLGLDSNGVGCSFGGS